MVIGEYIIILKLVSQTPTKKDWLRNLLAPSYTINEH